MLMMLLTPRLLVTASVLLAVTDGGRGPVEPRIEVTGSRDLYSSNSNHGGSRRISEHEHPPTGTYDGSRRISEHEHPPTGTYDREQIHPPSDDRRFTYQDLSPRAWDYQFNSRSWTIDDVPKNNYEQELLSQQQHEVGKIFGTVQDGHSSTGTKNKLSLSSYQSAHYKKLLFVQMLRKFNHWLRELFYEKDVIRGIINGYIPGEDEPQNTFNDNSRHDDDDKASLALQQSESHSQELLLDRVLHKIIDSFKTLTNETIAIQEMIKGYIPGEDVPQNSSEPGNLWQDDDDFLLLLSQRQYEDYSRRDGKYKASLALKQSEYHSQKLLIKEMLPNFEVWLREMIYKTHDVQKMLKENGNPEDESTRRVVGLNSRLLILSALEKPKSRSQRLLIIRMLRKLNDWFEGLTNETSVFQELVKGYFSREDELQNSLEPTHSQKLLFIQKLRKFNDYLRGSTNETSLVQEFIKGYIMREDKSQNSSEPVNSRHDDIDEASLALQQSEENYARFLEDINVAPRKMNFSTLDDDTKNHYQQLLAQEQHKDQDDLPKYDDDITLFQFSEDNSQHDDNDEESLILQESEVEDGIFSEQKFKELIASVNDNPRSLVKGRIFPEQEFKEFAASVYDATWSLPYSQNLLFDRMLFKILASLRTLANETIIVREILKGDIPREDESQDTSEPIQYCTHHVEQIQKRMLSCENQQKNILDSIVEFEQAYEILKESWHTKLMTMLSRRRPSVEKFLGIIKQLLRSTRGPQDNIRGKTRTGDKLQDSSNPATTLRQALAQLYNIQDHVKLEITNCTHQIDHFQKQMRLFEDQQIKVYDSITELKQENDHLIEYWKINFRYINTYNHFFQNLHEDILLLQSTDHENKIIMEDTKELDELQVSSELATTLEKNRGRLIFLTDPFKWENSIWQFQNNVTRKSDYYTSDNKQDKWVIFKQIDPQLKRWRLVATTVPDSTLAEAHGRVEPTDSGSPMEYSTWTFLGKFWWNGTNCDLQQCGWLVFNQTDPLLKRWRLVVSSPIRIEGQQDPSEQNTTLGKSHSYERGSGLPQILEDPLLVDELQDPMNPIKLGQGQGQLFLSKPVKYEDMSTWNFPDQTTSVPQFKVSYRLRSPKVSLAIQKYKSDSQNLLFDQMLKKNNDSLMTLANETIVVRELLKGVIPREDESQNSTEPIQNCTHHIEQIQKRMLSFEDQQKNVLYSIVEFEQAYEILRESWKTKIKNLLARAFYEEGRKFLEMIENVRPLKDIRGLQKNFREKSRTADKLQNSSKPATTLRQALAQLYNIQDHVKLEIKNCTHQIDHFQKQMLSFEDQQINVNNSITELKHKYKLLRENWKTELRDYMMKGNASNEKVYLKLYKNIQLLRSEGRHGQTIIMEDTQMLDELQVSSEKFRKRLIFLTDPFKWENSIWHFQSNESRKSPNSEWLYFKQIDPQLKRWRLVGVSAVRNFSLEEDHGRVEPTDSGSPMMHSTWTFLGKHCGRNTNCDLEKCGWLLFNQSDSLLKRWRLVISSPIHIEEQQNPSEPHTTLEKSHSYVVQTVPSKMASELPQSLDDVTRTTTMKIEPLLVDELQDPMNPIKLGQGRGQLVLSKPVKYEDMSTWNFPDQTTSAPQFKPQALEENGNYEIKAAKIERQTTKTGAVHDSGYPQLKI